MSKRNKIILETRESRDLKKLRIDKGLSLSQVAKLLNVSKTRVHQMESGRENVTKEYVDQFLKAVSYSKDVWNKKSKQKINNMSKYDECHVLIDQINEDKIDFVLQFLKELA